MGGMNWSLWENSFMMASGARGKKKKALVPCDQFETCHKNLYEMQESSPSV